MSEKLIIRNETPFTLPQIWGVIGRVLEQGRISDDGKSYCYVTTFNLVKGGQLEVTAKRNSDTSDTLQIHYCAEHTNLADPTQGRENT